MKMSLYKDAPPEWADESRVQRLRGDDVNRIMGLFAAESEVRRACQDDGMRERFRKIPNGWRDLRMAASVLFRLTDAVRWTVPTEKRDGLDRIVSRSKYRIMLGPLAHAPDENYEEVITTRELDELVSSAWEWRCRMCDERCDRCALGKVLDSVVSVDRAGGTWANIDIRRR